MMFDIQNKQLESRSASGGHLSEELSSTDGGGAGGDGAISAGGEVAVVTVTADGHLAVGLGHDLERLPVRGTSPTSACE